MEPIIPSMLEQYCSAYSIYPDHEGVLQEIQYLEELQKHPSLHSLKVFGKPGDQVKFAKNGGKALAEFVIATPEKLAYDELTAFIEEKIKAVL